MSAVNFWDVVDALAILAVVAYAVVVVVVVWFLFGLILPGLRNVGRNVRNAVSPFMLALAWMVSMIAMGGSLYLSEIGHLTPCRLCWYQRIVMYPLVLLLGIAVFRDDRWTAKRYFVPMALVGALISIYHYQLERFPSETAFVCSPEAPCAIPVVNVWGFASVPFMALAAFALIITTLCTARTDGGVAEV